MKVTLEEFRKARRANRVELESHEVELGLVDDLKANAKKFEPLFAKANADYIRTLEGFKQALSVLDDSEVIAIKGQTQVKELGLADKFFSDAIMSIKEQKAKVNSAINKLK